MRAGSGVGGGGAGAGGGGRGGLALGFGEQGAEDGCVDLASTLFVNLPTLVIYKQPLSHGYKT